MDIENFSILIFGFDFSISVFITCPNLLEPYCNRSYLKKYLLFLPLEQFIGLEIFRKKINSFLILIFFWFLVQSFFVVCFILFFISSGVH